MPFSLVLLNPELDLWAPGEHNGTFRGNQPAIIAAKAGLEVMLNEQVEQHAAHCGEIIGAFLRDNICTLDSRIRVRGIGCIWGVDFCGLEGDFSRKVMRICFDNGLIVERVGRNNTVVKLMPQLLISDEELYEGLNILQKAVSTALS